MQYLDLKNYNSLSVGVTYPSLVCIMNNPKWQSEMRNFVKWRQLDWIKSKINLKKKKQGNYFYWASKLLNNFKATYSNLEVLGWNFRNNIPTQSIGKYRKLHETSQNFRRWKLRQPRHYSFEYEIICQEKLCVSLAFVDNQCLVYCICLANCAFF